MGKQKPTGITGGGFMKIVLVVDQNPAAAHAGSSSALDSSSSRLLITEVTLTAPRTGVKR